MRVGETYVYQCGVGSQGCGFETEVVFKGGARLTFCAECRQLRKSTAARSRLRAQRVLIDAVRPMTTTEIHQRWPSTTWGVKEWFVVLQTDDALYFAILEGIAARAHGVSPRTRVVVPQLPRQRSLDGRPADGSPWPSQDLPASGSTSRA